MKRRITSFPVDVTESLWIPSFARRVEYKGARQRGATPGREQPLIPLDDLAFPLHFD